MSQEPPRAGPVTLGELAAGVRDEFLQWDRGLIGTFIAMLWKPAKVARAYLETRDERYTKPWRYLVFSIVVNVAVSWFVLDQMGLRSRMAISEQGATQLQFILDNAAILTLIILPLGAMFMRLFFFGLKMRYVDALVVLFYTQGQSNLFAVASVATIAVIAHNAAQIALTIVVLIYMLWAWASFAQGPWWRRILAAILTLLTLQALNAGVVFLVLRFAT